MSTRRVLDPSKCVICQCDSQESLIQVTEIGFSVGYKQLCCAQLKDIPGPYLMMMMMNYAIELQKELITAHLWQSSAVHIIGKGLNKNCNFPETVLFLGVKMYYEM